MDRAAPALRAGTGALLFACLIGGPALAQTQTAPDAPAAPPGFQAPNLPQITPQPSRQPSPPRLPAFPGLPLPQRPQAAPNPAETGTPVRLAAVYAEGGDVIARGVVWRVFVEQKEAPGGVRLLSTSQDAVANLRLPAGVYMVNASYGRASLTKRLQIASSPLQESFVLNAGGLRLGATVGDRRLPDAKLSFSIFTGPGPGGTPVLESVKPNRILRLPVGEYYVVSKYGEANAVMTGDVKLVAGRLTEATLHHRAAIVTLKLVAAKGGEAIANTAWSVLTPGGDTVQESIGAFPTMVLAAGEYSVIARDDGRVFSDKFTVDSGVDREIEVLAK